MQRSLLIFFDHDRDAWRGAMIRAAGGERIVHGGRLRPKERRPITVRASIEPAPEWGASALLWSFDVD
jgi:hypothetical protein